MYDVQMLVTTASSMSYHRSSHYLWVVATRFTACSQSALHSSWIGGYGKLQPMCAELFRKMPAAIAHSALRKVRDFAMAVTEPQQAADAMHVVASVTKRCPEEAERLLLLPLIERCQEDSASLQGVLQTFSAAAAAAAHIMLHGVPRQQHWHFDS